MRLIAVFIIVSLFFFGCSAPEKRRDRIPTGARTDSGHCLEIFRAIVDRPSWVDYQLNVDAFERRIMSFKEKYRNELRVKSAYRYDGREAFRIDMPARKLPPKKRIIITAGVHGNESMGTAALMDLIEEIVFDPRLRDEFDFVFYPNVSPGALEKNSRRLLNGVDANRTFLPAKEERLTRLFKATLEGEEFDLGIDMHEAFTRDGFFIIRAQEDDQEYLSRVIDSVDHDMLYTSPEGSYPHNIYSVMRPDRVSYVLSSPGVTQSFSRGTMKSFFKEELGVRYSYTVESTGRYELQETLDFYRELIRQMIFEF